jgi:hypothetical protein
MMKEVYRDEELGSGLSHHELEAGDRVRLPIGDKDYIEVSISTEEPDAIEVRVYDGVVLIRPSVTNKVTVGIETYLDRMRRDEEETCEKCGRPVHPCIACEELS